MTTLTFGQLLQKERLMRGYNLHAASKELGVSYHALHNWESDVNIPFPRNLQKLKDFYNLSMEQLATCSTIDIKKIKLSDEDGEAIEVVNTVGIQPDFFEGYKTLDIEHVVTPKSDEAIERPIYKLSNLVSDIMRLLTQKQQNATPLERAVFEKAIVDLNRMDFELMDMQIIDEAF